MSIQTKILHNNFEIFVNVDGEGEPLLLLHSYWGSSELFDSLAEKLATYFKVIRFDFPGHGKSAAPKKDYTFNEFAPTIDYLLTQISIDDKILLVGHSMGGYASMAFAKQFSERVKKLVLMHSPLCDADAKSIKLREREAALLQHGRKEIFLRTILPTNFAPGNETKFENAFDKINKISREVTLEGALAAIHAINLRDDSRQNIKRLNIPKLIIIGKFDKVYDPEDMMKETIELSDTKVLLLNQSGHLGFLEEEKIVVKNLLAFLS